MARVIYQRSAVSGRAWAIPLVLWVLGFVGMLAIIHGGVTPGNVIASVLVPGIICAIWLLTLWSINRYGSVTVTTDTLRSGRDKVPVEHLHRGWLEHLALEESPGLARRFAISASTIQLPGSTGPTDTGRLLGGAYGATLGSDVLTLQLVDGTRVSMQTNDREGVIEALLQATAGRP